MKGLSFQRASMQSDIHTGPIVALMGWRCKHSGLVVIVPSKAQRKVRRCWQCIVHAEQMKQLSMCIEQSNYASSSLATSRGLDHAQPKN